MNHIALIVDLMRINKCILILCLMLNYRHRVKYLFWPLQIYFDDMYLKILEGEDIILATHCYYSLRFQE